ncbi:MAG: hypothetical protein AAGD01_05175 [Acidobacteriota bacterium]
MSVFGKTLFSAPPFIRWTLTPVLVLAALFLPLMVGAVQPTIPWVVYLVELVFLALLAGFWLPTRYGRWAFRLVTATIFVFAAVVLGQEIHHAMTAGADREGVWGPVFEALIPFVAIGIPCLLYTLRGSSPSSAPPERTFARLVDPESLLSYELTAALAKLHSGSAAFDPPRDEAEEYLGLFLDPAYEMLDNTEPVSPYAMALLPDESVIFVDPVPRPSPATPLLGQLRQALRQGATDSGYLCTALIYTDTQQSLPGRPSTKVLSAEIDHHADYSVIVHLPLEFTAREPLIGEISADIGKYEVFGKPIR